MKLFKSFSVLLIAASFYSQAAWASVEEGYEPLRDMLEQAGARVTWNQSTLTADFALQSGLEGSVTIGNDGYKLNGTDGKLNGHVKLIGDKTYVPPGFVELVLSKLRSGGGDQTAVGEALARVTADGETEAVDTGEDAADDPAIWVHPDDPAKSKLLATNKGGGILVYNLDGKQVQSYKLGKMNNIDVRYGYELNGKRMDIAAATNRTSNTVDVFSINPETGALTNIAAKPIKPDMGEVYGFSLYHSLKTGKYYALVLGKEGEFEQIELIPGSAGVEGKLVRHFKLASQAEGIVADDEYGTIYMAEEDAAIWKIGAEPDSGLKPYAKVDEAGKGHLTADIEGLAIYYGADGKGYLMASSQGSSTYAVYNRQGTNRYLGSFAVKDGLIDGTTGTDGIDVVGFGLGPAYPNGIFVAQDDENTDNGKKRNQNFKIVSWDKLAKSFHAPLRIDNGVDPRKISSRKEG
ncbi:phytase [Paenibacillus chitinolyticus]|uniref:phytase n=1 Tax=Paenibacillus chitinolyticus TaxID=79263 RepID=UPI003D0012E8